MAKGKRRKDKKAKAAKAPPPPPAALAPADEALAKALARGDGASLSDRLNPDHPAFDAPLKARWKGLGKKNRAALVAADAARHARARDAGASLVASLPFAADADDHCESPPEAYADLAAALDLLCGALGRTRATLRIYDPYYCSGAMARHLGALGFASVRNDRVDFYSVVDDPPPHDVVVTNPPYSGDHVARLLDFCGSRGRPYCLLLPNYVAARSDYARRLGRNRPVYVCPRKRYHYWTPKAFRAGDKVQGHVSALGHRTSPFASFWHVSLAPAVDRTAILSLARGAPAGRPAPLYAGTLAELPAAVRP